MVRDYSYDLQYQKRPQQVANRVKRNQARAKLIKLGKVKKYDNKDVHHKNIKKGNVLSNLKVLPRSVNRRIK